MNNISVVDHGSEIQLKVCADITIKRKYYCINHGDQRVFKFEIIINVLFVYFRLL